MATDDPNAMGHPADVPAILLANASKEDLAVVLKAVEGLPVILLWTENPTAGWWCEAIRRARLFLICEGKSTDPSLMESTDPSLLMEVGIFAGRRGIKTGVLNCKRRDTISPSLPPEVLREKVSQWILGSS